MTTRKEEFEEVVKGLPPNYTPDSVYLHISSTMTLFAGQDPKAPLDNLLKYFNALKSAVAKSRNEEERDAFNKFTEKYSYLIEKLQKHQNTLNAKKESQHDIR